MQTWAHAMSSLNCDALIHYQIGGDQFQIPIEYEKVEKVSIRYEGLITKYCGEESAPRVLMISENDSQINSLMNIEKTLFPIAQPKLFFATIQHVLGQDKPTFINHKQNRLVI